MHAKRFILALSCSMSLLAAGCATQQGSDMDYSPETRQGLAETALGGNRSASELAAEQTDALESRALALEAVLARDGSEWTARTTERAPLEAGVLRTRIAVVLDTPLQQSMRQALAGVALDYPVHLINDNDSREALREAGCTVDTVARCAAQLRQLQGIRMLVAVHGGDGADVTVRYHDLELEETPRTTTLALPGIEDRVPFQSLESLADQILITSLEHARTVPWLARTQGRDEDGWVINAGEASALQVDDRLRVHRPGRLIRGPDGQVSGWIKGNAVGTVRVSALRGDDQALVTLVNGQPPIGEDVLLPVSQ